MNYVEATTSLTLTGNGESDGGLAAGIAPACRLASAKFADEAFEYPACGIWTVESKTDYLLAALEWAEEIRARVTISSFGFIETAPVADKYAETAASGLLHFACTMNNGFSSIAFPSSLSSVNAIGAINYIGFRANFSNYGSGLAFVAPGEAVLTTDRTGPLGLSADGYVVTSGTSFAAPHAAGVAALVLSRNPYLTPAQVNVILRHTAKDLGPALWDQEYGWGLPDAHAAILMASPVGATFLIDVSTRGDLGTADGAEAAVSDDGRQVAFVSDWDELVPDDGNGFPDVFMQDRLRGTVSRLTTAFDGSDADGGSRAPSIDVAGEVVAFESDASNLATGDGNGVSDIFVWMADSKMLTRVSVNSLGEEAHAPSRRPHVAGSGTIVFESLAANLTSRDDNSTWDVFARDTGAGVTELISASPLGDSGDAPSKGGTVSTDGRYVAFSSEAADLVPGDDNGVSDVFVRDRHLGVTIRASCDELGTPLGGPSWGADLSDDGRFVAFTTMRAAKDGDGRLIVVVKDLVSGALLIASQTAEGDIAEADSSETCISADGRFVAFETQADSLGWVGGASRVLRKDMWTGELTLISRSTNDLAPLDVEFSSRRPAISGDGRFVGFDSDFAMIPGLEGGHHVYLRDTNPVLSPWTDLQGASGTGWGEPRLSGAGLLAADSEARLDVVNAPPTSLGIILVATDSMPVPFHGGLLAAHPIDLLLPFTTDSNGRFVTTFRWPAAVRAGEIFVFQSLVRATASAEVLAVSNALKATAP